MSIVFILLFLVVFGYVVYYISNLLLEKRMTESFAGGLNPNMTINDSHYFLTTSILPGKTDIANLKETNPHHTDYFYVDDRHVKLEQTNPDVVSHRYSKLSYDRNKNNLTCIKENDTLRDRIKEYQPYMYDEAEIINYYDNPFYRDWRYPERPIDIRFAINPKKYVEENPHIYPSYKHLSKY